MLLINIPYRAKGLHLFRKKQLSNLINIPKKKFYDLIVINTNHKYFIKNYNFNNVKILLKKDCRILDPWNFFKAKDSSFIIKN